MKNHQGMPQTSRRVSVLLILAMLLLLLAPSALANEAGIIRNPNGGSYVNVRSWPSYDADIMAQLPVGGVVNVTGVTGSWYSVWVEGVVGYIHSNFVSIGGGGGGGGNPGTGTTATVNNGPLNVREAASMRARVITQLPTGTRVNVAQRDGTWTQITYGQIIGYVVSSYLTFSGGGSSTDPKPPIVTSGANATIRTANGGNLNLRAGGSSTSPVITSFGNGSRVRVMTQGASWSYVLAGSQYGYMATQYLVFDGGGSVGGGSVSGYAGVVNNPGAGQMLNLRAQPSTGSQVLGSYYNGTAVTVLGLGTQWHRVNVNGVEGYMKSEYVRLLDSGATPHRTVRGGENGFVNLRSGPGYDQNVSARVTNGSAATVLIPYPTWSQVMVRQGSGYVTGYMLNTFLY